MFYVYYRSVVDVFVRYPATSVVDVDAIKLRLAATEQAVRCHIFPDCFLSSESHFPRLFFPSERNIRKKRGAFSLALSRKNQRENYHNVFFIIEAITHRLFFNIYR